MFYSWAVPMTLTAHFMLLWGRSIRSGFRPDSVLSLGRDTYLGVGDERRDLILAALGVVLFRQVIQKKREILLLQLWDDVGLFCLLVLSVLETLSWRVVV